MIISFKHALKHDQQARSSSQAMSPLNCSAIKIAHDITCLLLHRGSGVHAYMLCSWCADNWQIQDLHILKVKRLMTAKKIWLAVQPEIKSPFRKHFVDM